MLLFVSSYPAEKLRRRLFPFFRETGTRAQGGLVTMLRSAVAAFSAARRLTVRGGRGLANGARGGVSAEENVLAILFSLARPHRTLAAPWGRATTALSTARATRGTDSHVIGHPPMGSACKKGWSAGP